MGFLTWLGIARELWELLQVLVKTSEVEGVEGEKKHAVVLDALKQIYEIVGGLPGVKNSPAWGVVSVLATKLIPAIVGVFNQLGVFKKSLGMVVLVGMFGMVGYGQEFMQVCKKGEGDLPQCRYVEYREGLKPEITLTVYSESDLKRDGWEGELVEGMSYETVVVVSRGRNMLYRTGSTHFPQCGGGNCYAIEGGKFKINPIPDEELGIDKLVVVTWLRYVR